VVLSRAKKNIPHPLSLARHDDSHGFKVMALFLDALEGTSRTFRVALPALYIAYVGSQVKPPRTKKILKPHRASIQ
jgi:hypothetical protein